MRRIGEDQFDRWFELDLLWTVDDGPINWGEAGRITDMGHAVYVEDGSDKRDKGQCPFENMSEIWEFDAVEEYGMPDFDELVRYYEDLHQKQQKTNPDKLMPGGYYKTLISGAIDVFGWDMLLRAAADMDKFDRVLETIFQRSLFHYRAWAETSIDAFICHDDIVWSAGAFMHPESYRQSVFPRFAQLWKPLREAGIKVLYCSDGDFTEFVDDLAAAGADGFIFEPRMDLDMMVEKFGDTHVLVGSKVDCRTMTYGSQEDIRDQIDRTLPLAFQCPGFIFAVGNHIPANVPAENVEFYINYLKDNWHRP
ncbi:MAG: uroporphyrinogen decarboxylase family protein [Candidatus Brocadiia bacterium]